MELSGALVQFSFSILFALLGTVLSMKLRQPYVVGLLLFGMLSGPHALSIISDQPLIETFTGLGAILLLFAVGIEFSVSRMMKSGFRAFFITILKMGLLFIFGYELGLYFGLDLTSALAAGAMISITSTAIMFKILTEKKMTKNPVLPLLFSMLIFEDVFAVAALTFFSSLGEGSPTFEDKFYSVAISLGMLGAFYFLVRKPAASAIGRLTNVFSQEVTIFVSFSLCLVLSMAAGSLGLSPAIGAFLAGSIVSSLPNSRSIERTIKPLLLMFASLFFLSLGMQIDPSLVLANLWFALALTMVFTAVCFISVFSLLYTTGSNSANALFGASSMVVLGEFSLLIAAVPPDSSLLLSVGSFGVVATAVLSSFLLDRQQQLLSLGDYAVPHGFKSAGRRLSTYISGLIRDFSPKGSFWKISRFCYSCAARKLALIAVIGILFFLVRVAIAFFGIPPPQSGQLRAAALIIGAFPVIYLLYRVLRDMRPVLDALSRTIARHKRDASSESVILRDFAIAVSFVFLSIALPEVASFLALPQFFAFGDELLVLLSFVFLWDVVRHAQRLHRKIRVKKGGR